MFLPYAVEPDEHEVQETPWTTYGLLAVLLLVHLLVHLQLTPAARTDLLYRLGAADFALRWYQPLTCALLHADFTHLLVNCYVLWIYGASLERLLGWWRLLSVAIVGGYFSILAHLWTLSAWNSDQVVIGASGAISALLGAFLVLRPRARISTLFFSVISMRPIHLRVPAWVVLGLWFGGQLIYSLQLLGEMGNVAFWAHVAGFAIGALLGTLWQLWRERLLAHYAASRVQRLVTGWHAWLAGDQAQAAAIVAELAEGPLIAAQGGQAFLAGLTQLQADAASEPGRDELVRAFRQANDYRDPVRQVTIYLQLLQHASPFAIPGDVHREAGFAAQALQQPALALRGFHYAIVASDTGRLPQVLQALEGLLGNRLQQPHAAAEVAAIRHELGVASAS
jgi:membrane associated rhomboid family serine protease